MSNEQTNTVIVVAYPDRGVGNDPKPLGLAFHHQGSTLLHWEYGSNDVPRPRRFALSECF